jgi:acyl-homoserine-lactone acylase
MLPANPHLAWSDLYSLFEAHLRCPRAGRDGVPLLGLPVLMIASTTTWDGHTVNTHRGWDFHQLTECGEGNLLDGQQRSFDTHELTLSVLAGRPHEVSARRA